jgi:branched-chain amino acid transport system permease protein
MLEPFGNVLVGGLLLGAVYALVATGLTVMFGVLRVVNFAHGEMVVVGMYVGYSAWKFLGIGTLTAVPLAAIVVFALGYLFQRCIGNRFLSAPQHMQFILFIALGLIITGLHAVIFGPNVRGIEGAAGFEVWRVGFIRFDVARTKAAIVALLFVLGLWAWLRFTLTGKAIRAAASNPLGGQAIGIRIPHLFALTAGIGAACAGVAGALVAPFFDTQPYLAGEFTTLAFIIVIVGGLGSLPGSLIGGLLIGVAEAVAAFTVNPSLKSLFSYALLIVILLFRPAGLLGRPGALH